MFQGMGPMTEQEVVTHLNSRRLPFMHLLGGNVIGVDREAMTCSFEFDVSTDLCHSVDVVQGGFVTAMLDAAMSHAVFALGDESIVNVSSLEIKTNYFDVTRAGHMTCVGKIVKLAYKTVFQEAALYNDDGVMTANASSVAKLVRKKS
jgi:uncharacterized protein (TIGR00369 family)